MKRTITLAILALSLTACGTLNRNASAKLLATVAIEEGVSKHCVSTGPQTLTFTAPDCSVVTAQVTALSNVLIDTATKTAVSPLDLAVAKSGLSDFLTLGPPHFTRAEADALVELIAGSLVKP
jgi:hypothetical protein